MSDLKNRSNQHVTNGGVGAFMFLAFIGAAVYFVEKANGFWESILGILKALVWPAFLVYEVLKDLLG
jgi:hypothetical protein